MTAPVERMQAAIEKLEQQRSAASPGRWDHQPYGGQNQNGDYFGAWVLDGDGEYIVSDVRDEDGELIATLHRTIDAQLEILLLGVAFAAPDALRDTAPLAALALADAILGHSPAPALSEREFAEVARFGIHPELGDES